MQHLKNKGEGGAGVKWQQQRCLTGFPHTLLLCSLPDAWKRNNCWCTHTENPLPHWVHLVVWAGTACKISVTSLIKPWSWPSIFQFFLGKLVRTFISICLRVYHVYYMSPNCQHFIVIRVSCLLFDHDFCRINICTYKKIKTTKASDSKLNKTAWHPLITTYLAVPLWAVSTPPASHGRKFPCWPSPPLVHRLQPRHLYLLRIKNKMIRRLLMVVGFSCVSPIQSMVSPNCTQLKRPMQMDAHRL